MTNTTDISGDYRWWSQTEAVTVTRKRAGVANETEVPVALRQNPRRSNGFAGGVELIGDETTWLIPADLVGVDSLETGDTIEDLSGAVWTIRSLTKITSGDSFSHWSATSKQEQA